MPRPRLLHPARFVLVLFLVLAAACTEEAAGPTGPAEAAEPPIELPPPQFALIVHDLTEIPTLGGTVSVAQAINDFDQVVGATTNGSGQTRGFLWENGLMQDLGHLGSGQSQANGINDRGQVVGVSPNGSGQTLAFLWENGDMQGLGTLGGTVSHATGINNLGQVVGTSRNGSGQDRAFLWQNGDMQDLGTLGGTTSSARAINELGQVVGHSPNGSGQTRAFLWENGAMQDLGTLGGNFSYATGINDLGQVVGVSANSSGEGRVFLWENGVMQDLGTLGGAPTEASINELGQIVGWSLSAGVAFLSMDETMYSLGPREASAINNHGQAVGSHLNGAGQVRGVVWHAAIRPPTDIQPGDAGNTVSLKKGKSVTVAILSKPYFTAQDVNPATVTLGDEQGTDTPVVRDRRGKPSAIYRDMDGDGDKDLLLEFSTKEMIAKGDLTSSTAKLVLLGKRTDGRALRAVEPATVVP